MSTSKKLEKNNSPSPQTYKIEEAYEKVLRQSIKTSFGKKEKKPYFEERTQKTKLWPGVGKYNLQNFDKVLTLGLSKGWK